MSDCGSPVQRRRGGIPKGAIPGFGRCQKIDRNINNLELGFGGAEGTLPTLMIQALSAPKPPRIPHCLAWRFLADSQTTRTFGAGKGGHNPIICRRGHLQDSGHHVQMECVDALVTNDLLENLHSGVLLWALVSILAEWRTEQWTAPPSTPALRALSGKR